MLRQYGVEVPNNTVQHVQTAPSMWNVLKKRMYQCRTMLEDTCTREATRLKKEGADFMSRANAYRLWYETHMPFQLGANPDPDLAYRLIDSQRHVPLVLEGEASAPCLAGMLQEQHALNQQEELFDLKTTVHEGLLQSARDLVFLKHVWDSVSVVTSSFAQWTELAWQGVNLDSLSADVHELENLVATTEMQNR